MNGPATQKPITMNLSIPIRPKRKAPGTAAKQVVRIGSEAALNECCGELSMCLYERPDVGLLIHKRTAAQHPVERVFAMLSRGGSTDDFLEEIRGR